MAGNWKLEADMQSVPQFVLKRLKETPPAAGSHPDADLLTAFAEQSLAGDERAHVMEHLAACGDCRDAVALALPATEIVALPASASSTRIGWLSLPALRWVAMAAGVLAVTSVGVLRYSHRNQQTTVASNRVQDAVAAPPALNQAPSPQMTVPQVTVMQTEARKKASAAPASRILTADKVAPEASRVVQPPSPARYGGAIHRSVVAGVGSGVGGGIGAGSGGGVSPGQAQNPTPETRQPVVVGRSSEVVEVQAADSITTESTVSQNQLAQNQTDLPVQGRNVTNPDVVKAKDPVRAQAASAPAPVLVAPGPPQASPAIMLGSSPRWTVSSSGALQRSFDGGNSWENIDPALSAAYIGGPAAKASTAKTAGAGLTKQNKTKRNPTEPAPNPAPVFRAVAASGLEIWAGATGGVVYHSSDGGNRWILTVPTDSVTVLTGDITSIQFSDPQHGEIATSTGELWITSDAGLTWGRPQ